MARAQTKDFRRRVRENEPNPWLRYETRKRAWADQHPGATPEQYAAAMQRIARELGI
jgi:hypothetical protein